MAQGRVRSVLVAQVKDQTRYERLLGRYRLAAFGRYLWTNRPSHNGLLRPEESFTLVVVWDGVLLD